MSDQAPEGQVTRFPHVIVRLAVRRFALEYAGQVKKLSTGQPRFTRVSDDWLDRIEAQFKAAIRSQIDRLPSNGRTIT
jgi:hypothetical protein